MHRSSLQLAPKLPADSLCHSSWHPLSHRSAMLGVGHTPSHSCHSSLHFNVAVVHFLQEVIF